MCPVRCFQNSPSQGPEATLNPAPKCAHVIEDGKSRGTYGGFEMLPITPTLSPEPVRSAAGSEPDMTCRVDPGNLQEGSEPRGCWGEF